MSDSLFIHLAVRTSYSLLESMLTPKALQKWAEENFIPAVAVTDRNNLFGALEISETLSGAGVQPIMACCFDVTDGAHQEWITQVSLYAQNEAGFQRLMELSSLAYLEAEDGVARLKREHLFEKTDGLILLTGGSKGEAAQYILKGKQSEAEATLADFAKAYPGRCYVELTRHGEADEANSEPGLIEAAYKLGLPLVATHDVRFMKPGDAKAHDALMCISNGEYLGQDDRKRVSPEQYLKTSAQMVELFSDLPEAIASTVEIAQRCGVRATKRSPILPNFGDGTRSEIDELKLQAREGLDKRLSEAPKLYAERSVYEERLEYELGIIEKMGFPGYFLIVADFIKWAKDNDIPVGPGRGSGAGSVVAWVLTITDLDPLRFDLLFERFLNPERVSMPDFDIDFCQERRGEVIRYVRDKYGADSVAAIITFGTLQAKAVVRDVGRVMQMPYGQVDRLAKLIPFNPANPPKLQEAIDEEPKFQDEIAQDPRVGELLETALALEGLYRNAGTHAAGVVIGDRPLTELVPLYNDPRSDLPATQFNMKWAESAGLVKFDFLGLKTLTVIDRALKFIRRDGRDVGPEWDSLDDQATYDLMASGDTLGVFQLEGQGMRDTLRKVRPGNLEDVIAIISLYRPGPMDNIPTYVAGKEDPKNVRYQHPDLEPILEATYGVPVYQEQVMRMAQEIAGYSLGEADLLRRAMGKKKVEEMVAQRARFLKGAKELKGIEAPLANEIFDTMEKFAGYGFNKSHAAAYALIGYQTAYLKCHFPVEFLAASMSLDLHNTDKLAAFVQEARRLNVPVIQPDVNRSTADFDVEEGALVYALGALKGVGLEAMRHVEAEREASGPFRSLHDFAERVDPKSVNKKCFEQLSRAGGFDSLEPNRASALAAAPLLAATAVSAAEDRAGGQGGLFGDAEPAIRATLPQTPAWNGQQKLDEEFAAVGFYLSGHPLDDVLESLEEGRITLSANIADVAMDGRPLELIGVVRRRVEKLSRSGGKFAFLTLSDPTGEVELMVMPEVLETYRDMLSPGSSVCMTVNVRRQEEEIRLSAKTVKPIEKARIGKKAKALLVRLSRGANYHELAAVAKRLETAPGADRGDIFFEIPLEDGRLVMMKLPETYATGLEALRALKMASGVTRVDTRAA
ncbi:DNA polymerase III subunit alpha [Henriciella pelagia]|uniref:DNA polymerase III subunit alpha n=3 Tax=Henriciella pelagia TaxID=1977912 RepID=A0ABQ1J7J7_9PROT|nr:DNA polymerase III subunit alpha [Henriciella pelagia]GGB59825.1 DNA polymerase III subunit alpha [Henriciella pelagia]